MGSLQKLTEEQKSFFDRYFWTMDCLSDEGRKQVSPTILNCDGEVQPFLHRSKKFYWEKAYLEYLRQQTITDKAAQVAEATMDTVYIVCNAFNAIAPALKTMLQFTPHLSIAWNVIDTIGALLVANRDESKQDYWAQGINLLSGLQLSAATIIFSLLNYGEIFQFQLGISSTAGSLTATGVSVGQLLEQPHLVLPSQRRCILLGR